MNYWRVFIGVMAWGFPPIFSALSCGYAAIFAPAMFAPVANAFGNIAAVVGLAVQLAVLVVWILIGNSAAANLEVPVPSLKLDAQVSTVWALVAVGLGVWFLADNWFQLWMAVVCIGSIIEAFATIRLTINNAAQKPIMQVQRDR